MMEEKIEKTEKTEGEEAENIVDYDELYNLVFKELDENDQKTFTKLVKKENFIIENQEDKETQTSIITLETIKEAVSALPDQNEKDLTKWLPSIMRLIQVRLIDVSFPLDKDGKPDFMDAWSAKVKSVGTSVLTAHDAMSLRDSEGMYQDPLDKNKYNACIP
jgi:hypothetical protein